jgi:hypothetical protein
MNKPFAQSSNQTVIKRLISILIIKLLEMTIPIALRSIIIVFDTLII